MDPQGLCPRVAHHVEFADHTHEELTAIAEVMWVQDAYRFDGESRNAFAEHLEPRMTQPQFVNPPASATPTNLLDRARATGWSIPLR